ncbi:unnamed protein product [Urochloa decumbens]|uniref:Uncharacterized protein n=1 Tax=Urochloa decumbens TaxID=240449 RepID=A0ABC8VHL5_9POAL
MVLGICPAKLLLLMLRATRFSILSNVVDGIFPVNRLLEMSITCIGRPVVDGSLWRSPFRLLKLTSKKIMLLERNSSAGRSPESELHDKLTFMSLVRFPSDDEMLPSRPMEASEISLTASSASQTMPFHMQQFVPFLQEVVRPESCESPSRNLRREIFSCSVQELVGDGKESNRRRATPSKCMGGNLALSLFHEEWSVCIVFSIKHLRNQILEHITLGLTALVNEDRQPDSGKSY